MVFSSFTFIFFFLPLVLALYYLSPKPWRNVVLLVASLLFYAWGAPVVVLILSASAFLDYYISPRLGQRRVLWTGITYNLLILGYFKYANFFIGESGDLLAAHGFAQIPWKEVLLPAGISFFTFEKISYLIDVHQKKAAPAKNFVNYLLFVSLFPHLIAGPILKYHDLAAQIEARKHSLNQFYKGWLRFCLGLAKKVLIADEVGKLAEGIFASPAAELTAPLLWLGIFAYGFQLYFDFAGYSDMAIGLARMFGFNFIENFDSPYISRNITEFWRRWHISLGNWMKEYLYIPLGGNRHGEARTYLNLWLVFLLSGLWHGAAWTFICWGMFHGMFLVFDRIFWTRVSAALPKFVNIALTFLLVSLGWVLFRSESIQAATAIYAGMFDLRDFSLVPADYYPAEFLNSRLMLAFSLAVFFSFVPGFSTVMRRLNQRFTALPSPLQDSIKATAAIIALVLCTHSIIASNYSPFLYFQF